VVFWTVKGIPVPAVTAAQMREVDRIAVEEFGLAVLPMQPVRQAGAGFGPPLGVGRDDRRGPRRRRPNVIYWNHGDTGDAKRFRIWDCGFEISNP